MKLKIVTLYHCPVCDHGHRASEDARYCCDRVDLETSQVVACPECGADNDVPCPGERFMCSTCQFAEAVETHPGSILLCPECMDRGREVPLRAFYAPYSPMMFYLACPDCCWLESAPIEPAVIELHAPDRQYRKAQEYARVHP